MNEKTLTERIGARILGEANDLKRTVITLSEEIGIDLEKMEQIIKGNCKIEESYDAIRRMGESYSIDISDLFLIESDCHNSIKIMRAKESIASSRIYERLNREKNKSPYYEYRDTVMSSVSPYKPERIKQLRVVKDNDPENPDVIYNNGHFMHQTTFFVGPVNFYYEINGEKFCCEMNTGDSNYITPYWPHSFASRDKNQEAYILAVTFGSDVRRAQKELYTLGKRSKKFLLEIRNQDQAIKNLIKQHMLNEHLNYGHLKQLSDDKSISIDVEELINNNKKVTIDDLKAIAPLLNIELSDLLVPVYNPDEEVVIKRNYLSSRYFFPDKDEKCYRINTLARTSKMPLLKSFDFEVLSQKSKPNLVSSLHTYIYNYGNSDVNISWEKDKNFHSETIKKDDSIYMQPFVNHGFSCDTQDGKLYVVRVSGAINFTTQKEMSYFADTDRFFNETDCWFD